jgi:hypothetical protein
MVVPAPRSDGRVNAAVRVTSIELDDILFCGGLLGANPFSTPRGAQQCRSRTVCGHSATGKTRHSQRTQRRQTRSSLLCQATPADLRRGPATQAHQAVLTRTAPGRCQYSSNMGTILPVLGTVPDPGGAALNRWRYSHLHPHFFRGRGAGSIIHPEPAASACDCCGYAQGHVELGMAHARLNDRRAN